MRYFYILISFILSTILINSAELPIYLKSDFAADSYIEWQMARYIDSDRGPHLVLPHTTREEYKKDLGPMKRVLTESGVILQQITNDNTAQTETWMAVNPTNPKNAIASANDFSAAGGNNYRMVSHATTDGGKTWIRRTTDNHHEPYLIERQGRGATIFDPILAFNNDGTALYVYGYAITSGAVQPNGVFCSISEDGGLTWNQWDSAEEVPIVTFSQSGLQDRYHTAVDNTGGQYDGRFYVAWKDFSSDGGLRVAHADKDNYVSQVWYNYRITSEVNNQAPFPIVGTDGTVWVSYRRSSSTDQTDAPIHVSTDGGETFRLHSVAMNNWNIGLPSSELEEGSNRVVLENKDRMRMSTNPQLAIDHSNGPYRGSFYCVMPGKQGGLDGPNKIYLGILRNPDPNNLEQEWEVKTIDNSPNGNDMFFPAISVDPVTGYIHVFYYSSQDDPDNVLVDGYYAYSYDGGETWKHKRLTDKSMKVQAINQEGIGNRYWGDYACITAYDNHVYPLFWVQENEFSYNSNELYTAELRTYPDRPENISTSFENGVTISWNGIFDGLGEPISEYDVKVFKNGNEVGTFAKDVNSWTDSDASSGDEITYGIQVISKDIRGEGEIYSFNVNVGGKVQTKAPENFTAIGVDGGLLLRYTAPSESVDNQPIENVNEIRLYSNGNFLASFSGESILSGEQREDFVQLPNEVYYENLYITAVRTRDGEEAESEPSNSSIAYTGEPIANLNESFEGVNIISHFTDAGWDVTTEAASDGNVSFTDLPNQNYDPEADNFVIFKPIIVDQSNPKVVMDVICNVASSDNVSFQVSNDFGKNWKTPLSTNVEFFDGWTGDVNTSQWLTIGLDHIAEGQTSDTLFVRVLLKSNAINFADGVFIDNMRLDNISDIEYQNKFSGVEIYPNPAVDKFTTSFNLPQADYVTPKVYDIQGNLIFTGNRTYLPSGNNELKINLDNLPNGIYYLQLENSNSNIMTPFSISK